MSCPSPWASTLPVRDSKNPRGPVVAFGASAWTAFVGSLKVHPCNPA
ncbi:DUF397 domain-containing protein [Streptomyces sp. HNM0645]|nr:DUF397 domain-containing protein [Streptomyces sp. HNM0645]MDI9886186.1 DUF397 domain-containing protein [Streptomyces sp. HNM0645]